MLADCITRPAIMYNGREWRFRWKLSLLLGSKQFCYLSGASSSSPMHHSSCHSKLLIRWKIYAVVNWKGNNYEPLLSDALRWLVFMYRSERQAKRMIGIARPSKPPITAKRNKCKFDVFLLALVRLTMARQALYRKSSDSETNEILSYSFPH